MKLNSLKPNPGSKKKRMIVGRGIGSGKGKTCGVGVKGQKARSGVAIGGFEGGQMPLFRRLPKSGFRNTKFQTKYAEINVGKIQEAIDAKLIDAKDTITEDTLINSGVVSRKQDGIKILGGGALKAKVTLNVTKVSKSAQEAIEKAGGKIDLITREIKPVVRKKAKPA